MRSPNTLRFHRIVPPCILPSLEPSPPLWKSRTDVTRVYLFRRQSLRDQTGDIAGFPQNRNLIGMNVDPPDEQRW